MDLSYRRPCFIAASLLLAATALGGCTDLKRALGMEKVMPDEFAVVSRAPLSVPPDYALRPPRTGEPRPQEESTADQARQTVFRAGQPQTALPAPSVARSPGEDELLRQAGAGQAPADIREMVDADAQASSTVTTSFVDRLEFWRSPEPQPGSVIDAGEEAARLRQANAAGEPADSGPPSSLDGKVTIERTPPPSWIQSLF